MKVILFARVSTNSQETERQVSELALYCKNQNYTIERVFTEKISGGKKNIERPVLQEMINYVLENKIQKVLVLELSRLGRNVVEILKAVQLLNDNKICLHIRNFNIDTLDSEGKEIVLSNFMIQILGAVAEIERKGIKERLVSGYKQHIEKGGKVGRKKGYKEPIRKFEAKYKEHIFMLKKGLSVRMVATAKGCSKTTVQKLKDMYV
jgi:DNA invertase Pin-like site-specific DNA recombinase